MADLSRADLRGTSLILANLSGAFLDGASVEDEELAVCFQLQGAIMPGGSRYDGHFDLQGDIALARREGITPADPEAMARWYAGAD